MPLLDMSMENMAVVTRGGVPSGTELGEPLTPSMLERRCSLVFVTAEPFHHAGILLRDHIRRNCPDQLIGPYSVEEYRERTKEGLFVCVVGFKIPDGQEFQSSDWLRLGTFRGPSGYTMIASRLHGQAAVQSAILLLERCAVQLLLVRDGNSYVVEAERMFISSLLRPGGSVVSRSLEDIQDDVVDEFAESLSNVLSSSCNYYEVDRDTMVIG